MKVTHFTSCVRHFSLTRTKYLFSMYVTHWYERNFAHYGCHMQIWSSSSDERGLQTRTRRNRCHDHWIKGLNNIGQKLCSVVYQSFASVRQPMRMAQLEEEARSSLSLCSRIHGKVSKRYRLQYKEIPTRAWIQLITVIGFVYKIQRNDVPDFSQKKIRPFRNVGWLTRSWTASVMDTLWTKLLKISKI